MSSSCIDHLNIEERVKIEARRLRLRTYDSVLCLSGPVGSLTSDDIQLLKTAVEKCVYKAKPVSVLELIERSERDPSTGQRTLTTGCEVLDQALRGGIVSRNITEIAGESASGKTQFALQLCLAAQLPVTSHGLDGGTAYICTEDAFPSKRLYQMIQNFTSRHGNQMCSHGNLGDKIFIEHVADYEGLMQCITKKLPILLSSGAAKLVVVDSVAAIFRSDYDSTEMFKRCKHISAMGRQLQYLAMEHNIPVVCINQVTSSMKSEGRQLLPSLGLTWSHHVTTRLMLSRTAQTLTIQQDSVHGALDTVVREMEIMFAPHLPQMTVPYVIDYEGMKGFK